MTPIPDDTDYKAMTPEQRIELSFRQLCLRLLDIDAKCDQAKGCPVEFAASPMINSWRAASSDELPPSVAEPLRRMEISSYDDGRTCPIGEVMYWARRFLTSG